MAQVDLKVDLVSVDHFLHIHNQPIAIFVTQLDTQMQMHDDSCCYIVLLGLVGFFCRYVIGSGFSNYFIMLSHDYIIFVKLKNHLLKQLGFRILVSNLHQQI
ncbi:hypothetical protein Hanom_Chr16g01518481 [Helianthus anomalus]